MCSPETQPQSLAPHPASCVASLQAQEQSYPTAVAGKEHIMEVLTVPWVRNRGVVLDPGPPEDREVEPKGTSLFFPQIGWKMRFI